MGDASAGSASQPINRGFLARPPIGISNTRRPSYDEVLETLTSGRKQHGFRYALTANPASKHSERIRERRGFQLVYQWLEANAQTREELGHEVLFSLP